MIKNKISYILIVFLWILSSCSSQNKSENKSPASNSFNSSKQDLITPEKANSKLSQEINKSLAKLNVCEGQIDNSISNENSSIYALNKQQYLIEFMCFLGAYQGNYEYFLYDNSSSKPKITPLILPVFEVDQSGQVTRNDTRSVGGIPNYNSEQQTLIIVTKYRGLGDCGSLAKYKWEKKEFKILEYRVKASCDGKYLEPEQYSRIYP